MTSYCRRFLFVFIGIAVTSLLALAGCNPDRNQKASENINAHHPGHHGQHRMHHRRLHRQQRSAGQQSNPSRPSSPSGSENRIDNGETEPGSAPGSDRDNTDGRTEEQLVEFGRETYRQYCAACHGRSREGNPPTIPSLEDVDDRLTRSEVRGIIDDGRGQMPAFGYLSDPTKRALLGYLFSEE